jgi:hypothetical protein
MSTVNLGRVQGGGIFYSTASSATSITKSTLTPIGLTPLVGDSVVFPNGDLRKITAVSGDNITCGSVAANFKGEKGDTGEGIDDLLNGTKIVAKAEQDANGNNIAETYVDKTSDQTIEGQKIFYNSNGIGVLQESTAPSTALTTYYKPYSIQGNYAGDTPFNLSLPVNNGTDTLAGRKDVPASSSLCNEVQKISYEPSAGYGLNLPTASVFPDPKVGGIVFGECVVSSTQKRYLYTAEVASVGSSTIEVYMNSWALTGEYGQPDVPNASNDTKIVTTEYLYPGSAEGNGVSSFNFVYRGVTHTIRINTSYGNTTSNWMRVARSGNTVTVGWTLALKSTTTLSKGTNYTIATGLPHAAHTENNYCVGIGPDGTVFTVYVNTSGQIILRPQTGNLVSQTIYIGCTYLTNDA